jgi:hypothetical protein
MIVLVAALFGAFLGVRIARKNGGKRADMIQYAIGMGIGFSILGVFATIVINQLLM